MTTEKLNITETTGATLIRSGDTHETVQVKGHYDVICMRDGAVAWEDAIENLVVTVGKNDLLDKYFAGSAYTAGWYMGLVDGASTPTYNAADTLASHAGWTENTSYSGTNRITVAWNAAASGSKASTSTSFSISGTATIAGAILTQTQVRATTTGILYSAGSFTGGNRSVLSGDTILVVFTASV
jgi:hypothetical protein